MKITAFNIELQSSHRFSRALETSERLEFWRDAPGAGGVQSGGVRISAAAQAALSAEAEAGFPALPLRALAAA
ncbi:hypothetical protein FG147_06805 [Thauera sp. UPWRP]|nr:hypothetical protein FG147_06805 [Thauera sp. UPWRP]